MPGLLEWLEAWLVEQGLAPRFADLLAQTTAALIVALAAIFATFVVRRVLLAAIVGFIDRTENKWDDALIEHRVFHRLAHIAPALVLYLMLPLVFPSAPQLQAFIRHGALAYMVVVSGMVLDAVLSTTSDVYHRLSIAQTRPIKTYIQVLRILLYLVIGILVLSVLLNRSPWGFLTGLGAMTAIILLVFKDTILGFVASIQLIGQDMVRVGDWIEMPKYAADGDVIDVSVNTIRVRNWDKTITTIPTYALVSESFKNWRGMKESGGRRIKRSLRIDMNSVRFCDEPLLARLERIDVLKDYLRSKREELAHYNREHDVDPRITVNGRRLTNLGTFRAYVSAYLRQHPKINKDLTFLVRHLQPDAEGIPLEIYVFSADQVWANYESIQADIFDHLLAALPEFELRVYQAPSGADVRAAADALQQGRPPPSESSAEPRRARQPLLPVE